jgi:hypothetical protein
MTEPDSDENIPEEKTGGCKGLTVAQFAQVNLICEDCYDLHQRAEIYTFCRCLALIITLVPGPRVARFSLVQHTQTGKYVPNGHKIYQMAVK